MIARRTSAHFVTLNAVTAGVADVRKVLEEAGERRRFYGESTLLLLDECHRWSKAQSDSILQAMEQGLIRFIGSTTENPMVSMTPALVSRCQVFAFRPLSREDLILAMRRALKDPVRGLGENRVEAEEEALQLLASMAGGDLRRALGALEVGVLTTSPDEQGVIHLNAETAREGIQAPNLSLDESLYYDMLSAFCKSLRGSDSQAALIWFARLITAGADPRLLVRRLIVHASEDVGLANSQTLLMACGAATALETVGMPEARIPIAEAIIYICESPKSDAVVRAVSRAFEDAENMPLTPVPVHLRDTHYRGAERLGSGKGYLYPHDFPGHYVRQDYMPEGLKGRVYYEPTDMGREGAVREAMERRGKSGS